MLVDSLDCLLLVFIRKMTNSIRRSCKISKAGRKLNLGLVKTAYFFVFARKLNRKNDLRSKSRTTHVANDRSDDVMILREGKCLSLEFTRLW